MVRVLGRRAAAGCCPGGARRKDIANLGQPAVAAAITAAGYGAELVC
ncbi:hypothetical protein [Dactylosporangium sp. NPDC005555]